MDKNKPEEIKIDDQNKWFTQALEMVLRRGQSLFLTGKAGTGKTTFLKCLMTETEKKMVVLAPTGVAAINAGGQTIHSFFKLSFGPLLVDDRQYAPDKIKENFRYNKKKITLIEELEILVIDEVSMVRADVLDILDVILKTYRNSSEPFGGVQMVLIGDVFQLPPVVKGDEWALLQNYYRSPFFFSARSFHELLPDRVELQKIYRQKDDDFIELLNAVRANELSSEALNRLNEQANIQPIDGARYITLATHNTAVESINRQKINALSGESSFYSAQIEAEFPASASPAEISLELKVGAQVMFVKNELGNEKRYVNGTIGTVKKLEKDKIIVEVDGEDIEVEQAEWENVQYSWDEKKSGVEKKLLGTLKQFPLKLAWAITVHKSQGLTFDYVIADLSRSFSDGQVYVALSRCTQFEGLHLLEPIPAKAIRTNAYARKFMEWVTSDIYE